jgi:hypothetical protein
MSILRGLVVVVLVLGTLCTGGPALCGAAEPTKPAHRLIGSDKGKVAIVEPDGHVSWTLAVHGVPHDLTLLPDGNVLVIDGPATVLEVNRAGDVVWSYTSKPRPPYDGRVEVHAAQRLDDGLTLIAETGNRRLIEVDRAGTIVHEVPLTVEKPNTHRDTRRARKLSSGHYLVCHEGDGAVREYDRAGKVVWSYSLDLDGRPRTPGHEGHGTEVFNALRLDNGNTLIAAGNGNRVIEVTPAGKEVWRVGPEDLPGIRLHWVTHLQLLPNGNLVLGNTHAGPDNPQLIEVTRDASRRVVWTFRDFTNFGNDFVSSQILDR